jgi:pantothenate synthetase
MNRASRGRSFHAVRTVVLTRFNIAQPDLAAL